MIDTHMGVVLAFSLVALGAAGLRLRQLRASLSRERAMVANQAALAELACTGFATLIHCLPEDAVRNRAALMEAADLSQLLFKDAAHLAERQPCSDTRRWGVTPGIRTILRAVGQSNAYSEAVRVRALRGSLDDAFSVAVALARCAIAPVAAEAGRFQGRAA